MAELSFGTGRKLISRREETAPIPSQANTAKLLVENPAHAEFNLPPALFLAGCASLGELADDGDQKLGDDFVTGVARVHAVQQKFVDVALFKFLMDINERNAQL